MELRIKLHSFVDVITNSSTVIYTQVNGSGVQMIRDLINEIISNVTTTSITADDLYDISIVPSEDAVEMVTDMLLADNEDEGLAEVYESSSELSWSEKSRLCSQYVLDKYSPEDISEMLWNADRYYSDELVIKTKHGQESKIDGILRNLFHADAAFDG